MSFKNRFKTYICIYLYLSLTANNNVDLFKIENLLRITKSKSVENYLRIIKSKYQNDRFIGKLELLRRLGRSVQQQPFTDKTPDLPLPSYNNTIGSFLYSLQNL